MKSPGLLLSLSIFVLSQAAVLVKWADAPVDAIGFWRLTLAVPVLALLAFRTHGLRELPVAFSKKVLPRFVFCGLILFLHWRLWFIAVQKTSIANATVCFSASPVLTALGAFIFFKEPIGARLIISLVLGLFGIVAMEWGQLGSVNFEGDLLGFLSTACFSGYVLSSKGLRKYLSNEFMTFGLYSFSALCFLLASWGTDHVFRTFEARSWWAFLALAIGPTLLGHSLFTYCLNFLNVNLMSCATLFEPILAAISAYLIFGEALRVNTLVAFALISAGVLILYWESLQSRFQDFSKTRSE